MSELMVSVSGVRGVVGETLSPVVVERFARAFGLWLREAAGGDSWNDDRRRVVLGRDSRPSGQMISAAAAAGLMAVGLDVDDVGIAPTPTIMLRAETTGALGALALTASHNPAPWNGIKMVGPRGMFLLPEEGAMVLERYHGLGPDDGLVPWSAVGRRRLDREAVSDHIERILALRGVDAEAVRARRFRVALDCGRGAGGVITPALLERLGCEVIGVELEPDGRFTRPPEPIPEHLGTLCRVVVERGAHIGLAHDADVDRLAVVTDEGEAVGEECTLALCVRHWLEIEPGPVVVNLSTSSMVERLCADAGVRCERTPVGEIHVAERLRTIGGVIGGEGNGGVIVPELHYTRDAPAAAALVLSLLARVRTTSADLVRSLPRLPMIKTRFRLHGPVPADLAERVAPLLPGAEVDLRDGVRLRRGDTWLHVRGSNTEPILRIIGEAPSEEALRALVKEVAEVVGVAEER